MLSSIILATLLVSLSSLVGGLLLFRRKALSPTTLTYFVSFAAGVILTTSFFDLLPEALDLAEKNNERVDIFAPIFSGIVLFFFLERFVLWFHHDDDSHGHGKEPTAVLVLLGDSFHNFVDGIIVAAAFIADPGLGVITAIAIAAHEIPHELADFTILVHSGMKTSKALFFNLLSSLVSLAGAIGGYFFLQTIEVALPYLLSFSAGMLIYIACSDLIPDLHTDFKKQKRWSQTIPFILGIGLMYFMITMLQGY